MKSNIDLIILAAGNATRFTENLPKALVDINGTNNLCRTFALVKGMFRNIYVICNKSTNKIFDDVINDYKNRYKNDHDNIILIPIDSGKGDGHAVLTTIRILKSLQLSLYDKFFLMWGDTFLLNKEAFDECIIYDSMYDIRPMLIPVVKENNPYVSFLIDTELNCLSVDFSKYGEKHKSGYHDQSIFLCCTTCIENSLDILESAFNKNGRYISESGENTFLYLVHYFKNIDFAVKAIILQNSCAIGYNTLDELDKIRRSNK